ncbi:T9SS type A sorting domain-containing protein, partial [Aquiflexum sp.]|uniref:T9SS type A sorting domain-containing protein n=1 Tax=Aquiflexum sp. TaxID=1872584 RepID=UPI0035941D7F
IVLESNILPAKIEAGQAISLLTTIDPADNIHTYSMEAHPNFYIEGNNLMWKGSIEAGNQLKATISSTDRAGQTISREVTLYREIRPSEILVYPNPATTDANIQVQLYGGSDVTIRIFDAAGRVVYHEEAYQENSFIRNVQLKGLANGMYHVIVKVDHQVMTKRLIKN